MRRILHTYFHLKKKVWVFFRNLKKKIILVMLGVILLFLLSQISAEIELKQAKSYLMHVAEI